MHELKQQLWQLANSFAGSVFFPTVTSGPIISPIVQRAQSGQQDTYMQPPQSSKQPKVSPHFSVPCTRRRADW